MSVSFCDIALTLTTPAADEKLERSCSLSDIWLWQRQSWPGDRQPFLTTPDITASKDPSRFKLQRLYWPRGASRWAHVHFLVTNNRLDDIQDAYGSGPGTLKISWRNGNNTVQDSISTGMYMLAPRPLATISGLADPLRELWLLTLVDARYYWWLQDTGDLTLTEGTTTWANLFTSIGTALGVSVSAAPNSAYLLPSGSLLAKYEYVPPFFDACAYNVGMRVVRALNGTVTVSGARSSQTALEANLAKPTARSPAGGGDFLYDPAVGNDLELMVPATVRVVFPKVNCGLVTGDLDTKTRTLAALVAMGELPEFLGTTGTPFTKTFHDTCVADYTGGSLTNGTELQALCDQIAIDYYLFNRQLVDQKYDGIVAFAPEGQSDSIEWTYRKWPDGVPPLNNDVTTRIRAAPFNDLTFDLLHASGTVTPHASGLLEKYGNIGFPGNLFFDKQRSWKPADVTLTGDQNDYAAPLNGPWLRINASPAVYDWINITGFSGGTEGLAFELTNTGSNDPIKLQHQSTLSQAANRLDLPGGQECVIQPQDTVKVIYDCNINRWYVRPMLQATDNYTINVTTTLNGNINSTVLSLVVNDHKQFPTDYRFKISIDSEYMLVSTTGASLTWTIVERGIDGTTAASHSNGATITWIVGDTTYSVNKITIDKEGMAFPGQTTNGIRQTIFPVTDQPLRIDSGPDGNGYYSGVRLKWDSTSKSWVDEEQVWIRDLDT